jgi:1,4-dihydroxy-2-naphthoate octaprenyltransferase
MQILRLARPQFLIASFFLFLLGSLWAVLLGNPFALSQILLGYLAVIPAHLSVSFSNDYFDVAADAFCTPAIFSGGSGILVKHPELRNTARWVSIVLICLSLALAFVYISFFSFPILFLAIIITGNLLGWFYAAPPIRLSYRGWGEISTTIVATLLPILGYITTNGSIKSDMLLLLPPISLTGLAFILSVEIPDEDADRLGNKKTWIVRMGNRFGFTTVTVLLFLSTCYFLIIAKIFPDSLPINSSVLILLSLIPLTFSCIGTIIKPTQKDAVLKLVNLSIVGLAVYLFLLNGYFLLLVT